MEPTMTKTTLTALATVLLGSTVLAAPGFAKGAGHGGGAHFAPMSVSRSMAPAIHRSPMTSAASHASKAPRQALASKTKSATAAHDRVKRTDLISKTASASKLDHKKLAQLDPTKHPKIDPTKIHPVKPGPDQKCGIAGQFCKPGSGANTPPVNQANNGAGVNVDGNGNVVNQTTQNISEGGSGSGFDISAVVGQFASLATQAEAPVAAVRTAYVDTAPAVRQRIVYRDVSPVAAAPVAAPTTCNGMWAGQLVIPTAQAGAFSVPGLGDVLIGNDGTVQLDCARFNPAALQVSAGQAPCLGQWSGVVQIPTAQSGLARPMERGMAFVTADRALILSCSTM
jgi:hypothetical protein